MFQLLTDTNLWRHH